jgi:hypothetical protein
VNSHASSIVWRGVGFWRRALVGTSGGNLEELRRMVRADGAWYVKGDSEQAEPPSVVVPWTGLEDLIRQCAASQIPDVMDSAILVPCAGYGAVVVLVRRRGKPFARRDLGLAVAWLSDHRPDGAAEPLVVGIADRSPSVR